MPGNGQTEASCNKQIIALCYGAYKAYPEFSISSLPTDLHLDAVGGLFTKRDPATDRHRHRVPNGKSLSGTESPSPRGGRTGQLDSRAVGAGAHEAPQGIYPVGGGYEAPGYMVGGVRRPEWRIYLGGGAHKAPRYTTDGARGPTIHYGRGTRPHDTLRTGHEAPGYTTDGTGREAPGYTAGSPGNTGGCEAPQY